MSRPSTKLHPLEFAVFKKRPTLPAGSIHRVVASVSGGADSLGLLLVLHALRTRVGFSLEVVHVHHGPAKVPSQTRFRDRAARRVERMADQLGLAFSRLETATLNDSEEACREARQRSLAAYAQKSGAQWIAMGHHADDLFETRMIRLIRGTGPQGLKAMSLFSTDTIGGAKIWRPFLETPREEIRQYLADRNQKKTKDWLEDPSNRDARYLRNAIRKKLLPMIEVIRPGAGRAMARSLDLIAESISSETTDVEGAGLNRAELLSLKSTHRRERIANWLKTNRVRGISRSQIDEILKRIDTPQKRLTFRIGGRVWCVDREVHLPRDPLKS